MTEKLRAEDIAFCNVHTETRQGSIHVETPAAVYHYTLKRREGIEGWVMDLYPCDCPAEEVS